MFKKKFQVRSIAETFTAGDCLRQRREALGLSLKDISVKLGIKREYLENLECGNYQDLPPQVYVRGFIKSYANFLDIDASQLIKIYNREISFSQETEIGTKNVKSNTANWKDYLVITPKLLTFISSILIIGVLGYYFSHQINSFNSKPYLFVESPAADGVVKEKDLWVKGKTEEDAILKINGQEVSVNAEGNFSQKVTLAEGRNLLVVEAKNRFNKTDRREINVVYQKPEEAKTTVQELPANSSDDAVTKDANASVSGDKTAEEKNGKVLGSKTSNPSGSSKSSTEKTKPTGTSTQAGQDVQTEKNTPLSGGTVVDNTKNMTDNVNAAAQDQAEKDTKETTDTSAGF